MRHDAALNFFGLQRPPFDKNLRNDDIWLDPSRKEAVERLINVAHRRQHALVRGEPGVGKSIITYAMKSRLNETSFRVVYLAHITLGRRDFYRQLSMALGLKPVGTMAAVFMEIQRDLRLSWTEHRVHPVLILDEAHLMRDDILAHLHVLANFDMARMALLSMIFVGLPELHERLQLGIHRSLLTRISTLVDIPPTTPEDTAAYLRYRLEKAGSSRDIFASDGLVMMHELASGIPRILDTLAQGAMLEAAKNEEQLIGRATVRKAWQNTPFCR